MILLAAGFALALASLFLAFLGSLLPALGAVVFGIAASTFGWWQFGGRGSRRREQRAIRVVAENRTRNRIAWKGASGTSWFLFLVASGSGILIVVDAAFHMNAGHALLGLSMCALSYLPLVDLVNTATIELSEHKLRVHFGPLPYPRSVVTVEISGASHIGFRHHTQFSWEVVHSRTNAEPAELVGLVIVDSLEEAVVLAMAMQEMLDHATAA